jgi:alpha-methylacyl-CoA racemase
VTSLEDAMRDPHFVERGLFAYEAVSSAGTTIAALPVPIAPVFRDGTVRKASPGLERDPP